MLLTIAAVAPPSARADLWSVVFLETEPQRTVVAGQPFELRLSLGRFPDGTGSGTTMFEITAPTSLRPAGTPTHEPPGLGDFTCTPWGSQGTIQLMRCTVNDPDNPALAGMIVKQIFVADAGGAHRIDARVSAANDTLPDDNTGTVTITASVPPPEQGKTEVVTPVAGQVLVRRPGELGFTRLPATAPVPNGAEIDARKGTADIAVLVAGKRRTVRASLGTFIVRQSQRSGITDLVLSEDLTGCPPVRTDRGARSARAPRSGTRDAAGAKRKRIRGRKLETWARPGGRFRTRGRYASALVRGTRWATADTCRSTAISVTEGRVSVTDNVLRRTVTVPAGRSYTARKG